MDRDWIIRHAGQWIPEDRFVYGTIRVDEPKPRLPWWGRVLLRCPVWVQRTALRLLEWRISRKGATDDR